MTIEEPSNGQLVSGVTNIRGWAIATTGITRVELLIDGRLISRIPYGSARGDVANAYPQYPQADDSGYSMIINWGLLTPGSHTVTARSYDNAGNIESSSATVTVQSFDNAFVRNPEDVVIRGGAVVNGRTITLGDVRVDGVAYEVILNWSTATQKWDIQQIRRQ
ncbi:MAG: Ig-like domain-containing protein [Cellvibrionaceae bacterium]|nr:Ig-like domain-containing protein [Cellvibrionaceae bacterium]